MIDLLNNLIEENKKYIKDGHVATYIPALAKVDPNQLGISIVDLEKGKDYCAGDWNKKFAIESVSKVITLIISALDNGLDKVFDKIDTEPTGFAFNSIINMEINHRKKPTNPFVNAGAIATTSLIKGNSSDEKIKRIIDFMKIITNNEDIYVNDEIYQSEKRTGDINRSLAYFMKGNNMIEGDIEHILDTYFMQCSVMITSLDLAKIGAVLANGGILPWNNKMVIPRDLCTIVKSLMVTCGLYDESGSFAVHIGVPGKSGVGGGILASIPKKYGIGIFGPAIDVKGNSTAGLHLINDLSKKLDLNIFE